MDATSYGAHFVDLKIYETHTHTMTGVSILLPMMKPLTNFITSIIVAYFTTAVLPNEVYFRVRTSKMSFAINRLADRLLVLGLQTVWFVEPVYV